MTVRATGDVIILEGLCPVEDAEPLLAALQQPGKPVDLAKCTQMHMAVFQVLLAAKPAVHGMDPSGFLGRWIAPMLRRPLSETATDGL